MTLDAILSAIDAEINKRQQARAVLTDVGMWPGTLRAGLPRKDPAVLRVKKRVLSEEARARIAAGQKRRWAAVRKALKPVGSP